MVVCGAICKVIIWGENFWNHVPNPYQNQHRVYPLQWKCFSKIIVSKFIKVSLFNEYKNAGLNKQKSILLFVIGKKTNFTLPNITIVEFCGGFFLYTSHRTCFYAYMW